MPADQRGVTFDWQTKPGEPLGHRASSLEKLLA
jgi:hypothetical protein